MALQLESARFRGDPVLERIRAADTTAYLKYGQSGEHIKAVQFALIDLGNPSYALPSGATGFFGTETSNAVKKFKQDEALTPADPVVGVGTIARLDGKWALPNADRDEWLSWSTRPIPEFNFSPTACSSASPSGWSGTASRRRYGAPSACTTRTCGATG
ncbi:peptidoglycan-binding protein [Streptomyces sp. NPDC006487]|uniref:peptidoglycan-binding domain-containing protein n=1 Tax=Streptomyces sp. NPDC006487 TaxID=3364748 RepID=UPI0036A80143